MNNLKLKQQRYGLKNRASQEGDLTISDVPTINGCCGLFDLCGDADLMSLSFSGTEPLLDWIGWQRTDVCKIIKNFVTWVRPARTGQGAASVGYVSNPCSDGNEVEWGGCDFTLDGFGRLRRKTPVRDITQLGLRLCEQQPRYRLDGSPITDDMEFDMRLATEVMLQNLKQYIVTGSFGTAGLFDGLEALVKDGYLNSKGQPCSIMDSIVVDWNGNNLDGGNGITWNGSGVANTYSLVDVFLAIYRRIRQRISWAPPLAAQNLSVGDMVIVGTSSFLQCLMDSFTCWTVCPGQSFYNVTADTRAALRDFRNNLMGGMFGAGRIFLDGFEIPLIAYDWGLQKGGNHSDAYFLTGSVGNIKLLNGQYNDMAGVPGRGQAGQLFDVTDGGRMLTWVDADNTCVNRQVEMQPRLLMWAPWAQARIEDVVCTQPGGQISPDPDSSFFPETSFNAMSCEPEV